MRELARSRSARAAFFKTIILLVVLLTTTSGFPYSVQTHEELVDLAWKQSIRPLLLRRFPNLTEEQMREAHAYAYGGCAIQDLGYYPFASGFFSNLTHYVRSGDFVVSLLNNAQTADELAFAIGALAHYIGDTIGHGDAVNHSVPIEFPKLERKYGPIVNYAQNPHAHVQTEFAFDINQISKHHFAPSGYLEHIGLEIPSRLLRKAFFETYGLDISDLLGRKESALKIYRFAVRGFLPTIARAEAVLHRKSFPPEVHSEEFNQLAKDFQQAESDNEWKRYDRTPGIRSHMLAGLIFIVPKIGVLSLLRIRGPNRQTEELYIHSVYTAIAGLRLVLANFDSLSSYLPNRDLDTGNTVKPGGYKLTDETYAKFLGQLSKQPMQTVPIEVKEDIAHYYADPLSPISTKGDSKQWARVQSNLIILRSMPTTKRPDEQ